MEKINLDIHENVVDAVRKIKSNSGSEIELIIPKGSVLFDNSLNIKLIEKEASLTNKNVTFVTNDVDGMSMIQNLTEGSSTEDSSDFVSKEVPFESVVNKSKKSKRSLKLPISLPKFSIGRKLPVFFGFILAFGVFAYGIYQFLWIVPKADIVVKVSSQPLIKSVAISVKPDVESDVEKKLLHGTVVTASVSDESSIQTTGEKTVGKKASGKIKIINRTTEDKEFNKGELLFSKDDKDLFYVLDDDITVPKATLQDPLDISSPLVPGTKEADVVAKEIGKEYNLKKNDDLEFDDFDSDDYAAEVTTDVDGGESKVVKIVAQADMDQLSKDLFEKIKNSGDSALTKNLSDGQTLIIGSSTSSVTDSKYDMELGAETDTLKLTQAVSFKGLSYKKTDLDKILAKLLEGFVPDGFKLLDKDMETNTEILGNSDATVLNLNQADLQVTIKAFVIPLIDENALKEQLVGVKTSDAEVILGKVKNITTYKINLNPNIPILRKLPSNMDNITLTIEKD